MNFARYTKIFSHWATNEILFLGVRISEPLFVFAQNMRNTTEMQVRTKYFLTKCACSALSVKRHPIQNNHNKSGRTFLGKTSVDRTFLLLSRNLAIILNICLLKFPIFYRSVSCSRIAFGLFVVFVIYLSF